MINYCHVFMLCWEMNLIIIFQFLLPNTLHLSNSTITPNEP